MQHGNGAWTVLGAGVFLTFFRGVFCGFLYIFFALNGAVEHVAVVFRSVRRRSVVVALVERPQWCLSPIACVLSPGSLLLCLLLVSCLLFPRLCPACLVDRLASFSPCILAHRTVASVLVVQGRGSSYQSTADSAGAVCWDEPGDARRVPNGGDCSTAKGRYLTWYGD